MNLFGHPCLNYGHIRILVTHAMCWAAVFASAAGRQAVDPLVLTGSSECESPEKLAACHYRYGSKKSVVQKIENT